MAVHMHSLSKNTMPTTYHNLQLPSGVNIHYARAGLGTAPTVLLLHGYPTSSSQYRDLIPLLADRYNVLAPDLPGFGHTTTPPNVPITFAYLASVIGEFLDALSIAQTAVYVFDYGAPTAFRLALDRPELFTALITQNGNAHKEGLGPFWDPLKAWWASGEQHGSHRSDFHKVVGDIESTKHQYLDGVPEDRVSRIGPNTYTFDYLMNLSPLDKREVQLDLFWDYQTNVALYPKFQRWVRESKIPVLAVWGKNDTIFVPAGAEAIGKEAVTGEVELLDGGHFLLETHVEEVAQHMLSFLDGVEGFSTTTNAATAKQKS